MRTLDKQAIENIALGAALLGAGGGGDPQIGKLITLGAMETSKRGITLLDPQEIPDDALIVPIAMMGAPTVTLEKAINGREFQVLFDEIKALHGKEIYAFMPIEAGGLNSLFPMAAAAKLGIPVVDADGMGRAFPELQMVTFTIGGVNSSPMIATDEKGNVTILKTITNKWSEELARSVTMASGGMISVSLYAMDGATLKKYGVKNIVTRSENLGKAIATVKDSATLTPEENFLKFSEGYKLFKGKIVDVLRETNGAFNLGKVMLEGIGEFKGETGTVEFQNENTLATVNGQVVASVPDLICLVDTETFLPVPTDAVKYGKRVLVVGLKCFDLWRTPAGLDLVGPHYFGYDFDYVPLEERVKGAK